MDLNNFFCEKHPSTSMDMADIANIRMDNITSEQVISLVMSKFFTNPLFSGGLLVSFAGFLWWLLDWFWEFVQRVFRERYFTSLEITNENLAYRWVVDHINKNSKWETRNLSVQSTYIDNDMSKARLDHKFIPGIGSHYFYYKNKVIYFERVRDKKNVRVVDMDGIADHRRMETVTLSTYGGSPEFWRTFLDEASIECLEAKEKGLSIHSARSNYWEEYCGPRRKRTLESVILADGVSEAVYHDVENFLKASDWYFERGIPYRRGYLFYGPPGTGKTSFIAALASHFGYGIAMVSMTNKFFNDSDLDYLINNAPTKTFIILEDIDVAFKNRDKKADSEGDDKNTVDANVTLSGLLNAIDGIASSEERILFMTTNYKEHLDSALIRPGRVDFHQYLGHCTPQMTRKMFKRFYGTVTDDQIETFVAETSKFSKSFSPAELQRHLIYYKNSPDNAIENVNDLITEQ